MLSWRISNTMDSSFCIEALTEALERFGTPSIFNTDQGSQFAADAFTDVLAAHRIAISMDGKGRALDNILVERLWRTLKYEDIYLKDYQSIPELKLGVTRYFRFYNEDRFHQSLGYETPNERYHYGFFREEQVCLIPA